MKFHKKMILLKLLLFGKLWNITIKGVHTMGKQFNKLEKRARRKRYIARQKAKALEAIKAAAKKK